MNKAAQQSARTTEWHMSLPHEYISLSEKKTEYVWILLNMSGKMKELKHTYKFLCCEWYSSKRLVSDCLNKSDLFKNNHVSRVRDIVTRRKLLSYWACLCYHWGWKLWPYNVVIHSCRLKGWMLNRARRWHRLRGLMWALGLAENRLMRLQCPWHPYLLLFEQLHIFCLSSFGYICVSRRRSNTGHSIVKLL